MDSPLNISIAKDEVVLAEKLDNLPAGPGV